MAEKLEPIPYPQDDNPRLDERRRRYALELAIGSAPQGGAFTLDETLARAFAFDSFLGGATGSKPTLH